MNASAYMHSRLSVLKGWNTCSGKVVHAQDDGVYGVGRLSMVKVYSVVYYDCDKCNAVQSGFVSLVSYVHGNGLRVRAEIQ